MRDFSVFGVPVEDCPEVRDLTGFNYARTIEATAVKNFETEDYDEELERLKATGIRTKDHTRDLCRRMIRTTDLNQRLVMAKLLKSADPPCRRLFIDYRGLFILGNWISDLEGHGQVELGNYDCK